MKPNEYTVTPTIEQFLKDGHVESADQSAACLTRLCEMAQYDSDLSVREEAIKGLRQQLPFDPVLQVIDGQLFLSARGCAFKLFIGDETDMKRNYLAHN